MARLSGSISLRLALGFLLVLAVFGVALLVSLSHLNQVKMANQQATMRQGLRHEVFQIDDWATQMVGHQEAFLQADSVRWDMVQKSSDIYRKIDDALASLQAQPIDDVESKYVEAVRGRAAELHDTFLDEMLVAKLQEDVGVSPRVGLDELLAQGRAQLADLADWNDFLTRALDSKQEDDELLASTAWDVSLAMAKIIFPLALLSSVLIIYYTHRSIVRPVGTLIGGTKELANGNLSSRIAMTGSGEFQELAEGFNAMAQALEANQRQLIEAEKMAGIGRLAAGVAHEINNPIAVILGYTRMLLDRLPEDGAVREQLQTVDQEARQCKAIVDGLLDLSRPSGARPGEVINPHDLLAEVVNTVRLLQLTDGIAIEDSVIDRPVALRIGQGRLRQLALNIVRNAVEAMKGTEGARLLMQGYIRPRAKLQQDMLADAAPDSDSFLILAFTDNGPGMSAEVVRRLFEPFFTTKADGMGLGLAITYNIARSHGGFIHVGSVEAEGTTFTVGLPLAETS